MKLYAAELDFRAVARESGVPETFPRQLHSEAAAVTDLRQNRRDMREVPLVTIDPVGSMDLDQAMCLEKAPGGGWLVRYAIADVGGLIDPASALFAESLKRGQTIYLPDDPSRLHPAELSEGAGSLLPDVDRVAVMWEILLDSEGEPIGTDVYPALVRSRARLDYEQVQADLDNGTAHPSVALLEEVGRARQASSKRRTAINLRLPAQRVVRDSDGAFELALDPRPASMDYNSEISLLAGMVAGEMMARHSVGVLRVLAQASDQDIRDFLVAVEALGFEAPAAGIEDIASFLSRVDAQTPRGMAVMRDASRLLRGSGYEKLAETGGENSTPTPHAGVGGVYAHVTAPLRRLIDRYGLEFCLAIAAFERGETKTVEVPGWVTDTLDQATDSMKRSGALAATVDRKCLNLTESVVLAPWVGTTFDAAVLHNKATAAEIFVARPPVIANCVGSGDAGLPQEGTCQAVTLVTADPAAAEVTFAWPAD